MELKDRISTVIQVNQHTASSFADLLGVPRSRISHILNGRNKPSIDFIQKIIENFPRVDPGWLLTGEDPKTASPKSGKPKSKKETTKPADSTSVKHAVKVATKKEIAKIVIFYTDQTFETYEEARP